MAKQIQVRLIMQLHADGMSQDDIAISRHYTAKNNDRVKRLLRCAKLRYPNADINTMYYC